MSSKKHIWPHGQFVQLRAHMGAGQWYKTVGGKPVYFGVLRDPDAALRKYTAWLQNASIRPSQQRVDGSKLTLRAAFTHFLNARHTHVEAGELSASQYSKYRRAVILTTKTLGRDRLVADLLPADFDRLRQAIPGTPRTVSNVIRDIRTAFKWVDDFYRVRPIYGQSFKRPSQRTIRKATGKRELWTAAEIRALLKVADSNLRAMILLGINCAFGQTDCSELRWGSFNLECHWFARPKTGIERRCPLWPETIAAIMVRDRWQPDIDPSRVFLTKYGNPIVREIPKRNVAGDVVGCVRTDATQGMLHKACKIAGVDYRPFYTFRHTFRSVVDISGDSTAVRTIMGHAFPGMDDVYLQLMADGMKRLKVVTDIAHRWLFES
jgi:integrase